MKKGRRGRIIALFMLIFFVFGQKTLALAAKPCFHSMQVALKEHILSIGADKEIEKEMNRDYVQGGNYVAFVSIGQKDKKAIVVSAVGDSVWDAYDAAIDKAKNSTAADKATYLRVDFVNTIKELNQEQLKQLLKKEVPGHFRKGISLNNRFYSAFLEEELNGNRILNYEEGTLNKDAMNDYLRLSGRETVKTIPNRLAVFTCRGFIYDNGKCYTLNYKPGIDYGIRYRTKEASAAGTKEFIDKNVSYLANAIDKNGRYFYCQWADTGEISQGYGLLRHAGTTWELVKNSGNTKSTALKKDIDRSIDYLLKNLEYKDEQTAFIVHRKQKEIELGGNGLALLALTEYERTFATGKYTKLCEQLGNGIIYMMDKKTGKFNQLYYFGDSEKEDFSLKKEYVISFYDGEASYALCLLYGLTGDKKWLDAAEKAVNNFLKEGREAHNDHWVAYTLNEITKYLPKEEYFHFAMQNLKPMIPAIRGRQRASFPRMEQLMCYFELYDRMQYYDIEVQGKFDEAELINSIYARADFMMNARFYPETAMYMDNPSVLMGVVHIREDHFRVQIDDVQHFLGGYQLFYKNMHKLEQYKAKQVSS